MRLTPIFTVVARHYLISLIHIYISFVSLNHLHLIVSQYRSKFLI
jgi:hypothetical protein